MLGVDAKVELASSSLPDELITKADTEEHLFDLPGQHGGEYGHRYRFFPSN